MRTRRILVTVALLAAGALFGWPAHAEDKLAAAPAEDEVARIAADGYLYGFPLVLMDTTRQVLTAVPKPSGHKAPLNQFVHLQKFPVPTNTDVVSPNADTLYSVAFLNLAREPMILTVPEMGKRYYLMQMLDAWTNVFAAPGTRTTGNGRGNFAVVGPGWKGTLPEGVKEIRSPTNMVWLLGRTQTNGKEDYSAVHAVQARYRLTPLSGWGKDYSPPAEVPVDPKIDAKTPPVQQMGKMEATEFFARLTALLPDNPPAEADRPMLEKLARIGVVPGKPFDAGKLDPAVAKGLERGVAAAREKLAAEARRPQGRRVNNWSVLMGNMGRYGTDYMFRAVIARILLGVNLLEDAIYARAAADADGEPLTGANRYVIRFPKGQTPPVEAFWSVTMYNARQFFIDNPIDRYAIGDRDRLKFDDDGSLTLYIQYESPGKDRESNWLPAPKGEFNVIMRLYWPKKEMLEGNWKPPAVERVK